MSFAIKAQFEQVFKIRLSFASVVCALACLLPASSIADTGSLPEQIHETTVALGHDCDSLLLWADGSGACLDKDNKQLLQLAADGKPSLVYARDLERPQSISINPGRVAVLDRKGLQVFARTGELLYRYNGLKSPRSVGFSGSRLLVNDKTGLLAIVDASSARQVDQAGEPRVPLRKLEFLASDTSGRVYAAARRDHRLLVYLPDSARQLLIDLPGVRKVLGLATDGDDNVYLLVESDAKKYDVLVYHGLQQLRRFTVGEKLEVGGFSVTAGEDAMINVVDKAQSVVHRYQYRQQPARVTGLRVRGNPDRVELDWVPSTESFVAGYDVYASASGEGELEKVGEFKQPNASIPLTGKRWLRFAVAARSRSGLEGEPSIEVTNGFESGYRFYRLGDYRQALSYFLQHDVGDGTDVSGQEYLARSLLQLGNWPAALAAAGQLEYLVKDTSTARLLQAEALYRLQRYEQAKQRIAGIASTEAWWLCARINHATGKLAAARDCLDRLLKQQPDNLDAKLLLLDVAIALHDRKREAALLNRLAAMARKNGDAQALASIGRLYLQQGNLKTAATWLGRALKLDKKSATARGGLIELYMKRNNVAAARSLALSMIGEPGQQLDGYLYLGDIAMQQQKPGEAAHVYRRALELAPDEPRALLVLARSYQVLGNRQQLRTTLERLLKRQPLNTEAMTLLAGLEQQEGHTALVIDLLQQVLATEPRNRELHLKLSRLLADDGDSWLAARHALAADQIQSQDDSVKLLAELSQRQGRFDEALKYYGRLAKQGPHAVMANLQIAEIHLGFGRYRAARIALERVLRLQKNNRAALRKLVQVYRELDQYRSAIHMLQRLMAVDKRPEYRLLLNALQDEQKQASGNKKTDPSIAVTGFRISPIVAPALQRDKPVDIASLSLVVKGKKPVKDVLIRSFVGDFVGATTEQRIDTLQPGVTQTVNLQAGLGGRLQLTDDQLFALVIEIHVGDKVVEKRALLPVFGRNVIDWSIPGSVKRFISGQIVGPAGEAPDLFASIADAYTFLDLSGVELQSVGQDAPVQYVQSPLQTLRNRKGSTADLGLLFASMMTGRGADVALAHAPDRLLLLVAPGEKTKSLAPYLSRFAVRYHDRHWLPLDMGSWSNGLVGMLKQGKEQAGIVDAATVVELPARTGEQPAVAIDSNAGLMAQASANERHRAISWLRSVSVDSAGDSPLRAGDWFRQHGYPLMALEQYRQALLSNPYNVTAANRLGEQLHLSKQSLRAIECYRRAARIDPFDAASRNSLAEIFKEAGQAGQAAGYAKAARLLAAP